VLTESQSTASALKRRVEDEEVLERVFEKQGLIITQLTIHIYPGVHEHPSWLFFAALGVLVPTVVGLMALVRRQFRNKGALVINSGDARLTSDLVFPEATAVSQIPAPIIFTQQRAASDPLPTFSQSSIFPSDKVAVVRHAPNLEDY